MASPEVASDTAEAHREYGEMIASISEQEQTPLRNQLLEYCERDTYAMIQIHRRLREMVGEPGRPAAFVFRRRGGRQL